MLPDSIVNSLGLQLTGIGAGESFRNNCGVYLWSDVKLEGVDVYVMDCDRYGKPLEEGMVNVYCHGQKRWIDWSVTTEALTDTETSKPFIIERIKKLHVDELSTSDRVV